MEQTSNTVRLTAKALLDEIERRLVGTLAERSRVGLMNAKDHLTNSAAGTFERAIGVHDAKQIIRDIERHEGKVVSINQPSSIVSTGWSPYGYEGRIEQRLKDIFKVVRDAGRGKAKAIDISLDQQGTYLNPSTIRVMTQTAADPLGFNGPTFQAQLVRDAIDGTSPETVGHVTFRLHGDTDDGTMTVLVETMGEDRVEWAQELARKIHEATKDPIFVATNADNLDNRRYPQMLGCYWPQTGPAAAWNQITLTHAIQDLADPRLAEFAKTIKDLPPAQWLDPGATDPRLFSGRQLLLGLY